MELFDFRKKVLKYGDESFLSEVIDFLVYQDEFDPNIESLIELFGYDNNNISPINREDYNSFVNKQIVRDYFNAYGISFKNLTPKEKTLKLKSINDNFSRSIEASDGLAFHSCNLYKPSADTFEDTCFVLNVAGSNLFKVATVVYQVLKENNISCTLRIPFVKDASIGSTSSVRINVFHENIVDTVSVLESLPNDVIKLISEPSLMYARVNSYIGYDFYKPSSGEMQSFAFLTALSEGIHDAATEMINLDPNALIDFLGDDVVSFREYTKNKLYADLRILSRSISVDPALKDVAMKHFTKKIKLLNRCEYVFADFELETLYNTIDPYHKIDLNYFIDESQLAIELQQTSEAGIVKDETVIQEEYFVNPPKIELSSLPSDILNKDSYEGDGQSESNDVTAVDSNQAAEQEEILQVVSDNSQGSSEQIIGDRVNFVESETGLRTESINSFQNRKPSSEEYLDQLLKSVQAPVAGDLDASLKGSESSKGSAESISDINLEVTQVLDAVDGNVSLTSKDAILVEDTQKRQEEKDNSIESDLQRMTLGESSFSSGVGANLEIGQIVPNNGNPDLFGMSQTHNRLVQLTPEELEALMEPYPTEAIQETIDEVPTIDESPSEGGLIGDSSQFDQIFPSAPSQQKSELSSSDQAELEKILTGELDKSFGAQQQAQKQDEVSVQDLTPDQIANINSTLDEVAQASSAIEQVLSGIGDSLSSDESEEEVPYVSDDNLTTSEISNLIKEAEPINVILTRELEEKYEKALDSLEILNEIVPGTNLTFLTYFENNYLLTTINPHLDYRLSNDEIISGKEFINRCVIRDLLNDGNVPLGKLLKEYGVEGFGINNPHITSRRKGKFLERFRKNI